MKVRVVSTLSYGGARVASALVGVLSVPIYTHLLTLEAYGTYAIAYSTVAVLNALLFHWITAATARIYPRHLENIPRFIGLVTGFWARSVVVLLVFGVVAWLLAPSNLSDVVLASSVLLVTTSMYEFALELSRSALRPGAYGIAVASYAFSGLAVGSLLAWNGYGAVSPLWGLAAGQATAVVVLRWVGVINISWDADVAERRSVVRHMVMYGVPLSAALVLSMLLASVDRYLIEHFLGLATVAIYAAAYGLIFPGIVLIASVINLTGYPRIMRAFEAGDSANVRTLLREQITALLVVLLPLLLGAVLLARPISEALPSGRYSAGVELLPYIALAAILNVLRSTYVDLALHISKKVLWLVGSLLIALTVGVAANVVALPRMGITGAALALCGCYFAALVMSGFGAAKYHALPLPAPREAVAVIAGLLSMWVVLRNAPAHMDLLKLGMVVTLGAVVYGAVLATCWFAWTKTALRMRERQA